MKKTIIAIAVLGATTGLVQAQSNVTVYGVVDTGFVKESSTSARMGSNETSRIGFRGQEDLGNGLKATFELEQRLNLNDGTRPSFNFGQNPFLSNTRNTSDFIHQRSNIEWQGAANLGLASSNLGAIRFGRINELSTETYRKLDPFNQNSVGTAFYTALRSETLSNTARYDSPDFNGLKAGLSYSLRADDASTLIPEERLNAGYAASLQYDNGPLYLVANYNRLVDSDKANNWNLGSAYSFGDIRISAGYERTNLKPHALGNPIEVTQTGWLVGLQWQVGPGSLNASFNHGKLDHIDPSVNGNIKKYALGYTYRLSKRTSVYGVIAHTESDNDFLGNLYNTNGATDDSVTGYQIGLNHKF